MGIQGLSKLIADNAPGAIKNGKFESYFGRKIAIDASMHLYQFMAVVGRQGEQQLMNEAGEVTSHLQGMFSRTVRLLEAGIKPIYVFDGKPPQLKKDELDKRKAKRTEATEALDEAKETGNAEDIEKQAKRTIRVGAKENEECKRLLRLMGVPVVEAPSEAEAQCAALVKADLAYGTATEDMDALTFATPRQIRHLMAPASQKPDVAEYSYDKVVEGLGLSRDEFIDLCILMGCDYCPTIKGIGPVRALDLIKKHRSIEGILETLDKSKYQIPDEFRFQEARELFKKPEVMEGADLPAIKFSEVDEKGLIEFLVLEKSFNESRVKNAIEKIKGAKGKANQGRLESFFGPTTVKSSTVGVKRKEEPAKGAKGGPAAKKGKLGGVGGGKKK